MIELRWRVLAHPAASPQLQYRLAVAVDASGAFCPGEPGEWNDVETAVCPAPHAPAEAAPSPAPTHAQAWNHTTAELAAIYGEMAVINETAAKDQNEAQRERLKALRAEAVAIGERRYALAATRAPAVAHSAQQEARAGIHDGLRMALSVVELHGMGGDVIAERIKELIAGCAHPACAMCRGVGSYGEPPKRCEFCALSAISHVPVQGSQS